MSTDSVSVSGSGSLDKTAAAPDELTRHDPEIERNATLCVMNHVCMLCNMVFGNAQALGGHRSNSSHHHLRLQGQDPESKPVLQTRKKGISKLKSKASGGEAPALQEERRHLNSAQKNALHQKLLSFQLSGVRPHYSHYMSIAEEIDGLEGGRHVDAKCVQHWWWRPTYPTSSCETPEGGGCAKDGESEKARTTLRIAHQFKFFNGAQRKVLMVHLQAEQDKTTGYKAKSRLDYTHIAREVDRLEGGRSVDWSSVQTWFLNARKRERGSAPAGASKGNWHKSEGSFDKQPNRSSALSQKRPDDEGTRTRTASRGTRQKKVPKERTATTRQKKTPNFKAWQAAEGQANDGEESGQYLEEWEQSELHPLMQLEGESSDLGAVVVSAVAVEAVVVASSTFTSRLLQLVKEVKQEAAEAQELREMGEYSQEEEAAVVLEGKHRIAAFKAAAQTLRESVNS
eukprot:CAMPEP_0179490184 /NCGR_PEP_ID=MMETSP0799-20121207/65305_1 /TAXON_ID=46947 /ORGANISM="Geminigera cryophila, Strain CCMP2564" /LENGTH=455 /DNA_ID=CAMNT_0021306323 /DNA_START=24 /DNA_END=1391 /DNA_ORIENTATION=+